MRARLRPLTKSAVSTSCSLLHESRVANNRRVNAAICSTCSFPADGGCDRGPQPAFVGAALQVQLSRLSRNTTTVVL